MFPMNPTDMSFEFNVFDLMELLTLVAGALAFYFRMDKRVTLNENTIKRNSEEIQKLESGINSKLDRIFEKLDKMSDTIALLNGMSKSKE